MGWLSACIQPHRGSQAVAGGGAHLTGMKVTHGGLRAAWGLLAQHMANKWPWTWWDRASAMAADLLHAKPPATQLPKET